jgi:hydroxyacylglutathione hydrolase
MPAPYTPVAEGDTVAWGPLQWQVLDVPGHTAGHVAYWAQPEGQAPILFCGDTLFSGGCGRLFEGTPAQMLASLDKLAQLDARTRVCCAHEYTMSNLRFAQAVDPDNAPLAAYTQACQALRAQQQPTLPARLGQELEINPFLRSRDSTVRTAVTRHAGAAAGNDAEAFGQLREWKNQFK